MGQQRTSGEPLTVLLVDDHAGFLSAARALLEADGLRVVGVAGDGATAVAATLALHPEVAVVDVQLPDVDGFEVARQLARLATPPWVVLTSSRDPADFGQRLADAPAVGFIGKVDLTRARLEALVTAAV